MTLSINNEFDWEGIQVKISLPSNYDPNQTYPAILLNDGNLDFLSSLSESVILVGLTSKITDSEREDRKSKFPSFKRTAG